MAASQPPIFRRDAPPEKITEHVYLRLPELGDKDLLPYIEAVCFETLRYAFLSVINHRLSEEVQMEPGCSYWLINDNFRIYAHHVTHLAS